MAIKAPTPGSSQPTNQGGDCATSAAGVPIPLVFEERTAGERRVL